jgi:hypothetical protein
MCSLNVWRIGVSFNLTFWDALPEASSRESWWRQVGIMQRMRSARLTIPNYPNWG